MENGIDNTDISKQEHLERILTGKTEVLTWKRNPDGAHLITLALTNERSKPTLVDLAVTDDDLQKIDSRLPSVVKHMAEQYSSYIQTDPLVLTYSSHWTRQNYKLRYTPCAVADRKSMDVHTWFIHEFTDAEIWDDDKCAVFATLYHTGTTPDGIEYAKSRTIIRLFDLGDWLHECVPGGVKVFDILQSLDIPDHEWGSYIQKEYEKNLSSKRHLSNVGLPSDLS